VDQFSPENLIQESLEESQEGGLPPFRASDFVVGDLEGTGQPDFIIAAYTNGFSAAVRVLKKQGGTFVLADQSHVDWLTGIFPSVRLLDLDGDKKPEIIASFSGPRGAVADWVFRWNGNSLELISPQPFDADGRLFIALVDSLFVDLDRDGKLEVISARQVDDELVNDVFGFDNLGHLQFRKSLNYFRTYYRHAEKPNPITRAFITNRTELPYVVKILNGDPSGQNRVSSAEVSLNGVTIAGPNRFSQQVSEINVPVALQQPNEITVELGGAPGSQITVVVELQQ